MYVPLKEWKLINYGETLSLDFRNTPSFLLKDSRKVSWTSSASNRFHYFTALKEYNVYLQSILLYCVFGFSMLTLIFLLGLSLRRYSRGCSEVFGMLTYKTLILYWVMVQWFGTLIIRFVALRWMRPKMSLSFWMIEATLCSYTLNVIEWNCWRQGRMFKLTENASNHYQYKVYSEGIFVAVSINLRSIGYQQLDLF